MRVENEPSQATARLHPDLEAEREVDFGRYARAILARWWLVAAAVAAGIAIGYVLSLGGGTVYRGTATVYLGQPLSPSGSAQIQSLGTNPSTASQIVKSQSVVGEVAEIVGVKPGKLRSGISTKAVSGAIARQGQTPLVEISVRGPWRRESAEAANLLARRVVSDVSGYVDVKIDSLQQLLESQNAELESIEQTIEANQAALAGGELSGVEKLVVVNSNQNFEQRRGQLLQDRAQTRQLLTLARDVERGRVVTEASPVKVSARSKRNSLLVGAFIGLIAGCALALLWGPLVERRRLARA